MLNDYKKFLAEYEGPPLTLMEICGTHTAEISRNGIPGMLSKKIRLISGPGCPVCVTVTDYIDKLVKLSLEPCCCVVSFGDMLRVKGSKKSLSDARAEGGSVRMVYSPLDMLAFAQSDPKTTYIFAAVGFETTIPVYALLLKEAEASGLQNIRLLTSLKTMPPAVNWICRDNPGIDGFLAPGHVSVITGSRAFFPLAQAYHIPFAVAGFTGEQILAAIAALVQNRGKGVVKNLYRSAVTEDGNQKAQALINRYFVPCDAAWRGLGVIPGSGMALRQEYQSCSMMFLTMKMLGRSLWPPTL